MDFQEIKIDQSKWQSNAFRHLSKIDKHEIDICLIRLRSC